MGQAVEITGKDAGVMVIPLYVTGPWQGKHSEDAYFAKMPYTYEQGDSTMRYDGPERRRHPRIPIVARVKLLGKRKVDYFFTRDISMCGCRLISDAPLKRGDWMHLDIAIGGTKKLVKVSGKVARVITDNPRGVGVEFMRFAPHSKARLSKALENLNEEEE